MINKGRFIKTQKGCFCTTPELIENYDKAINDNTQTWHCHHRLEDRYSRKELIKLNKYYFVNPDELIFLTRSEHRALHNKISPGTNTGKTFSHTWRENMKTAIKKVYENGYVNPVKNTVWCNNGIINKRVKPNEVPDGFVLGRLEY